MNFDIEIRNKVTGRAVTLPGKQAVADFLAGLDKSEWEGYTCLGTLPEPTQLVKAESDASPIVDTSVDPILPPLTEAIAALPDGTIVVGGGLPVFLGPGARVNQNLELSVGDSGAGDSYLPADAAGEQA